MNARLHHKLASQVYHAEREGRTLDHITVNEVDVRELAEWCRASLWPRTSIEDAEQAIRAGHLSFMKILVKVG